MGRVSGQPTRHGSFDHLYLRMIMMVLASVVATSFVICFFSLSPHAPASAPHILGRGCGSRRLLPYSSDTSPDTAPHSGYCTSTRVFHNIHAPSFSPSSDVPFVFSAFALFFLPNLLPPPTVAATGQPTLVDAGTGAVLLLTFLRACRRGG